MTSIARPSFFPGQIIQAADLNKGIDLDRTLRSLHHQALHGWGLASGLRVVADAGAVEVRVEPGYGLDVLGTELVITEVVTVPVPPVAAGPDGGPVAFCLVLRATTDGGVDTRAGACGESGAVRISTTPDIVWLRPESVRNGFDLLLADVQVANCALVLAPDPAGRRLLVPPSTPYIAAGWAAFYELGWARTPGQVWAVTGHVDTSEAGFGDVPVYQVTLGGTREVPETVIGRRVLVDGVPFVQNSEPGRFTVVVPLRAGSILAGDVSIDVNPPDLLAQPGFIRDVLRDLSWSISWIGVQR